jgi:hypothetical protein
MGWGGDEGHRTQLGWGGDDRRRLGAPVCDILGEARRLSWDEISLERNVVLRGDCYWRDGRWTGALGRPHCGRIGFADHRGSEGYSDAPE